MNGMWDFLSSLSDTRKAGFGLSILAIIVVGWTAVHRGAACGEQVGIGPISYVKDCGPEKPDEREEADLAEVPRLWNTAALIYRIGFSMERGASWAESGNPQNATDAVRHALSLVDSLGVLEPESAEFSRELASRLASQVTDPKPNPLRSHQRYAESRLGSEGQGSLACLLSTGFEVGAARVAARLADMDRAGAALGRARDALEACLAPRPGWDASEVSGIADGFAVAVAEGATASAIADAHARMRSWLEARDAAGR